MIPGDPYLIMMMKNEGPVNCGSQVISSKDLYSINFYYSGERQKCSTVPCDRHDVSEWLRVPSEYLGSCGLGAENARHHFVSNVLSICLLHGAWPVRGTSKPDACCALRPQAHIFYAFFRAQALRELLRN
jgi:hypothetical protein